MKKKIFFAVLLLCAFSFGASAQLTTGNPSSKEVRTGNRPQAGDFGLYYGVGSSDIITLIGGSAYPLPVFNFKYFLSNQLELRVGLDGNMESEWFKGKRQGESEKSGSSESYKSFYVMPGVAYHFSKHNIIDVYAGAEAVLGYYGRTDKDFDKGAGTKDYLIRNSCRLGITPFVGLQCFIANLPMAIGVEYGLSASAYLGEKYKYVVETGGSKQVYYTPVSNSTQYDKLSAGNSYLEHDIRIIFSYYFK